MGEKKLTNAGSIKPGGYIILDNMACVVRDIQTSKPGKHGSTKCRIEAVGIIGGQKKIHMCPSSDNVEVPIIQKKNAQVLSLHGEMATVMDNDSYETFDINIAEDVKDKVKEGSTINYWIILDQKVIMDVR